jgi:hypothetical protein
MISATSNCGRFIYELALVLYKFAMSLSDMSAIGLLGTPNRRHSRLLPATPERIANRLQLLPHFSIAWFQRLREEEGCVA